MILVKKNLKHGGVGDEKSAIYQLVWHFQLFLFGLRLGVISAGRIPGRCPSTRWGAVLAPTFWAPKSYSSRNLLPLLWDLLFFLQTPRHPGSWNMFHLSSGFFFFWGKTSQTLRESHASKLLLFCRTQRDGHQPSRTRREWPERAGRQLLTWAATFSSTGMRHVQQLGSPARCFFFLPPLCRECRVEGARQWSSAWYIFTNMYTLLCLCHISLKKVCKCV